MTGKPYQSCLIPYRLEIFVLRSQKPPVSYARIAEILREKHWPYHSKSGHRQVR